MDADSHQHSYIYANAYPNRDADAHAHAYTNLDAHADQDMDAYHHAHAAAGSYCNTLPFADAYSHVYVHTAASNTDGNAYVYHHTDTHPDCGDADPAKRPAVPVRGRFGAGADRYTDVHPNKSTTV